MNCGKKAAAKISSLGLLMPTRKPPRSSATRFEVSRRDVVARRSSSTGVRHIWMPRKIR